MTGNRKGLGSIGQPKMPEAASTGGMDQGPAGRSGPASRGFGAGSTSLVRHRILLLAVVLTAALLVGVGVGIDVGVGPGAVVGVGSGADVDVEPGADVDVEPGADVGIGRGADVGVGRGADVGVGRGADVGIGRGVPVGVGIASAASGDRASSDKGIGTGSGNLNGVAGKVTPALAARLAGASEDDFVRVLVRMEEQPFVVPAMGPDVVRFLLQETASRTQKPVLQHLQAAQKAGHVRAFTPFWLVNVVFVDVRTSKVAELAGLPGVALIYEDVLFSVPEVETRPETDGGTGEGAAGQVGNVSAFGTRFPGPSVGGAPAGGLPLSVPAPDLSLSAAAWDLPLSAAAWDPPLSAAAPDFPLSVPAPRPPTPGPDQLQWDHVGAVLAPPLWELGFRGQGVTVAVIDTGVDMSHPELVGAMGGQPPFHEGYWVEFDQDGHPVPNSMPHDSATHGTHVSATVLGRNVTHQIGVAPEATLAHALVIKGGSGTMPQVLAGMQWVADEGFDVINGSLGSNAIVPDMAVATDNLAAAGVIPIFANGNIRIDSVPPGAPGNTPSAVAVGAFDGQGKEAVFNRGDIIEYPGYEYDEFTRIKPDVSAPGVEVLSAYPGGGYALASGTSMASPHVAGVVALLLSAYPELTVADMKEVLFASTGGHKESHGWDDILTKDIHFGWGRVNALQAFQLAGAPGGVPVTVHGVVTSDAGGALAGAAVTYHGRTTVAFVTDENGYYEGDVEQGIYSVRVEATRHEPALRTVNLLGHAGPVAVDFELKQIPVGGVLSFRNAFDSAAEQAQWTFLDLSGAGGWTFTDSRAYSPPYSAGHGSAGAGAQPGAGGQYPPHQRAQLVSPPFTVLPGGQVLSFRLWGDVWGPFHAFHAVVQDEETGETAVLHTFDRPEATEGWVEVNVALDAYVDRMVTLAFLIETDALVRDADAGAFVDDVRVGAYDGDRPSRLRGRVLNDRGQSIGGALVTAVEADPTDDPPFVLQTMSAANGAFELALPGGRWTVRVTKTATHLPFERTIYISPGDRNTMHFNLAANTEPAPIQGLTAQPQNGAAALSWDAVVDDDLAGYNVYAAADGGGWHRVGFATGPSFGVEALQNGVLYHFRVAAMDVHGLEGQGAEATAVPGGDGPTVSMFDVQPRSLVRGGAVTMWAQLGHTGGEHSPLLAVLRAARAGVVVREWSFPEQPVGEFHATVNTADELERLWVPDVYEFTLIVTDEAGREAASPGIRIALMPPLPQALAFLLSNNPFNPHVESQRFEYTVPSPGRLEVAVYTLDGRRVRTLVDGERAPGQYVAFWDGTDSQGRVVPGGMYAVHGRFTRDDGTTVQFTRHSVVVK